MTGVPSRPATHRHSGPDEKQALLTFHQELTETCVDLMSRYSFANCGVTPRKGGGGLQMSTEHNFGRGLGAGNDKLQLVVTGTWIRTILISVLNIMNITN